MVKLEIVAAVAEDRAIGVDGELPWDYSNDLKRFKELTTGHPLLMGRKTHESIMRYNNGPLDDRFHVVLSSEAGYDHSTDGVSWCPNINYAIGMLAGLAREMSIDTAYVIGGASVYRQIIESVSRLHITEVPGEYPAADAYFPEINHDEWREASREDAGDVDFVTYELK